MSSEGSFPTVCYLPGIPGPHPHVPTAPPEVAVLLCPGPSLPTEDHTPQGSMESAASVDLIPVLPTPPGPGTGGPCHTPPPAHLSPPWLSPLPLGLSWAPPLTVTSPRGPVEPASSRSSWHPRFSETTAQMPGVHLIAFSGPDVMWILESEHPSYP